jgi:hypothetical protein
MFIARRFGGTRLDAGTLMGPVRGPERRIAKGYFETGVEMEEA